LIVTTHPLAHIFSIPSESVPAAFGGVKASSRRSWQDLTASVSRCVLLVESLEASLAEGEGVEGERYARGLSTGVYEEREAA
jgi:hypothetical protein